MGNEHKTKFTELFTSSVLWIVDWVCVFCSAVALFVLAVSKWRYLSAELQARLVWMPLQKQLRWGKLWKRCIELTLDRLLIPLLFNLAAFPSCILFRWYCHLIEEWRNFAKSLVPFWLCHSKKCFVSKFLRYGPFLFYFFARQMGKSDWIF